MGMEVPSPQCVGQEFVRQYYTLLHEAPNFMHRFYSHDSSFVHGGIEKPGEELPPVTGQAAIHKKILSLNFSDCHAKIRQVDSQATIDNAVVVQVVGELSNAGQPMRRFMQTFVLAAQSPKKYYVHNDIFRYQDEVFHDDSGLEEETDIPEAGTADEYEEADVGQGVGVIVENGDHHVEQQLQTTGAHEVEVSGTDPSEVAAQESLECNNTEQSSCSEPVPELNSGDLPTEGTLVLQPSAPTTAVVLESPAVAEQPQIAAAPAAQRTVPPKQHVEFKAPEPVKQVSWAALAGKGTSSSSTNSGLNPTPPKPQATVKPELKPETSSSTAALPQRAPRVVERDGFGESSSVSGHDGEDLGRRGRYPDNLQVFVGNLPHNFSDSELREQFEKYGAVTEVRINRRPTKDVPNFAFVIFESADTVQKVLNSRPMYVLDDKYRLNIEEKKPQTAYRPGGAQRGSPRGGFRGGFGGPRGGGREGGGWRGGRGARSGFGRSSDDDNSGDDRSFERPSISH